jgi:signal transduction histidine kinase
VRRRLAVLVAATTSAVVLAFLVPLALLLQTLAEDRAMTAATLESQYLVGIAAKYTDREELQGLVEGMLGERSTGTATVVLPDGTVLGPPVPEGDPLLEAARRGRAETRISDDWAVVYAPAVGRSGTTVVRIFVPEEILHRGVTRATLILSALGVLLLAAAVLAADRLAHRVSAPINELVRAADAMCEGRLETRVSLAGTPEVAALGRSLNRLAERVQNLLAAERNTVADLSHRLRTPVTAIRLDVDSISDPDTAERMHEHVTALERTIDAIVQDARRPSQETAKNSCDVGAIVAERVEFWSALADDQGRQLRLGLPSKPLRARLTTSELKDAVDVLIDNVFAHTDEGVSLEIWVTVRADGNIVVTVEDDGPGLPEGDVTARGLSGAGSSGLGMDIARRAALVSGGSLELDRSRLGGALIRLVLGPAGS